jgi:hypothetical protein
MPAFVEFLLVAAALYLWESTLWLPLRSVVLRRRWSGGTWKILDPTTFFTTRELGLIPMLPLPPDAGLAPCQAPPLLVNGDGEFVWSSGESFKLLTWNDLRENTHHLMVAGRKVRISTPRCVGALRREKNRGRTLEDAVRRVWRLAMSPGRAGREWLRWKLVSGPLRWSGALLTLGFFVGLPLAYMDGGGVPTVLFAMVLWSLMAWTAARLWWLGQRVYPDARPALRMDALLALLVPFHAMRALEIAAVHAMGNTHPVGLLLSSGDVGNPWLGRFVRRILHPQDGECGVSSALRPILTRALSGSGKILEDFDFEPDRSGDAQAASYCPRCHGLYLAEVATCPDCRGFVLRAFAPSGD